RRGDSVGRRAAPGVSPGHGDLPYRAGAADVLAPTGRGGRHGRPPGPTAPYRAVAPPRPDTARAAGLSLPWALWAGRPRLVPLPPTRRARHPLRRLSFRSGRPVGECARSAAGRLAQWGPDRLE